MQDLKAKISLLTMVYTDHRMRLNCTFFVSLICGCLTVLLITWVAIHWEHCDLNLKILGPSITSFLSGTLFWIYREELKAIKPIEKDIRIISQKLLDPLLDPLLQSTVKKA